MAEYVTREDIVSTGATALTDLYDDADPGEIQAPTSHIGQLIAAAAIRLDNEAEQQVWGIRLTGDAISGNPVIALGAHSCGAEGAGVGNTTLQKSIVVDVDITVKQGSNLRIIGLLAGTAAQDGALSYTLVFN